MANIPFGFGMPGAPGDAGGNFEALARQYWSAWGDMLRLRPAGDAAGHAGLA